MKVFKKGYVDIPLKQLKQAPWNYKVPRDEDGTSEFMHKALVKNLRKNGQIQNLVVRQLKSHYEVIDGNHRLVALNESGLITSAKCFNVGKVTKEQAQRLAIELNETKFEADDNKLAVILDGIFQKLDVESLIQTMPFNESELTSFDNYFQDLQAANGEPTPPEEGQATGNKGGSSGEFVKITVMVPRKMSQRFYDLINRFKTVCYPNEKPEDIKILDPFYKIVRCCEKATDEEIRKL